MPEDVIIVGAGPAGLAAALQLRRYNLRCRIFEGCHPGGLLWNANRVENYPGFPSGIPGPNLAQAFITQAVAAGVEIIPKAVQSLEWGRGLFLARTLSGVTQARAAVIASGTRPRLLTGFPIPEELRDRVCYDVAGLGDMKGAQVVIVGAGDAAFDYALNLGSQNSVIILNRGEQVKCLPLLWERAQSCPNISHHPSTTVRRLAVGATGEMTVECFSPGGTLEIRANVLIGAIGRDPQLEFVSASLLAQASELEDLGILHFVGDVKNGILRQTAIAVGDGLRAAMSIYYTLEEHAHESDRLKRQGRNRPGIHR